jgi:hypothetical protein
MILLSIEMKEQRAQMRLEARRADGRIPEPDSFGSSPPISPEEYASLPAELDEELLDELS